MILVHTDIQVPYTSNGDERGILGEVRAINSQLKVYNGSMWQQIHTTTFVNDLSLRKVVEWATKKMQQEQLEQQLAEKYPAFKTAKENYDLIKAMVENE
jgi:hypothetical protein